MSIIGNHPFFIFLYSSGGIPHDLAEEAGEVVGILDAFWESKGLVTPEKYRESCAPIVLLARLQKRAYTNAETFTAKMASIISVPKRSVKGS